MIKTKNIYAKASPEDGKRILVDLFWPEGLKTREAGVDDWLQELGPSYDLQRFHFSLDRWEEYRASYEKELLSTKEKRSKLRKLAEEAKSGTVTFLFSGSDSKHNHAVVLKDLIETNSMD
ncbi:DUF488 family protein [bacterium]|nr:DUF488 family protein [bacterium]